MSNEAILLIIGGTISLISVGIGALFQHLLEMHKLRIQLSHEKQSELERENRAIEKELLQEVGRISMQLPEQEWKQITSKLDRRDTAIFTAGRLRAKGLVTGKFQEPDQFDMQAIKYCLKCGAVLEQGHEFCANCGTPVNIAE